MVSTLRLHKTFHNFEYIFNRLIVLKGVRKIFFPKFFKEPNYRT